MTRDWTTRAAIPTKIKAKGKYLICNTLLNMASLAMAFLHEDMGRAGTQGFYVVMVFATKRMIGDDLLAGISAVQKATQWQRNRSCWTLRRWWSDSIHRVKVKGLALLGAFPGTGL